MKTMRLAKMQGGGYLSALEQSRPELFQTISNYRSRLSGQDQKTFDTRAGQQYKATMNMPTAMRQAYISDIEKQYAKPTDAQFAEVQKGLQSKTFTPTYQYRKLDTESYGPTTGYYRNLSKEIAQAEKDLSGLTLTQSRQKTVPVYTYYEGRSGAPGLPGSTPGVARSTTKLPEGSKFSPARGGGIGATSAFYTSPKGVRYTQQGTKKITETTTRPQRAGDAEYDRQSAALDRLRTRHKYRNMYSNLYSNESKEKVSSQNVYANLGMNKSFTNPYAKYSMSEGGVVKGQGKAIRGKNFRGVK